MRGSSGKSPSDWSTRQGPPLAFLPSIGGYCSARKTQAQFAILAGMRRFSRTRFLPNQPMRCVAVPPAKHRPRRNLGRDRSWATLSSGLAALRNVPYVLRVLRPRSTHGVGRNRTLPIWQRFLEAFSLSPAR